MSVENRRILPRNNLKMKKGAIVYWMNRDQRVHDNWALLYAQELALELKVPLVVFFGLAPTFLDATLRHYGFMLKGMKELQHELEKWNITFVMRPGKPENEIVNFCDEIDAGAVVTDFSPLRLSRKWLDEAASALQVPLFEVDAHNIVPCWVASPKQEYGAYTLRPKLNKLLPEFLLPFGKIEKHPFLFNTAMKSADFEMASKSIQVDRSVVEVGSVIPGERAAKATLTRFIKNKLSRYSMDRNDPTIDGQSNLSAYLHFGQISAQRVALEVLKIEPSESTAAFLEELIIRKELSDNFCFYNPHYDSVEGFPNWAKATISDHTNDPREYLYSEAELENACTHDDLWNAAQNEMVKSGKMHGYMRMYWAKKILEWTPSVKVALKIAIHLNDKYQLDGCDPNGYAGIAWSLGGVHDRAWFTRAIFGKIRFMSYNGCKSKFSVADYIKSIDRLPSDNHKAG